MTTEGCVPLRQAKTPHQATFLELFFDLALVFALFQISNTLAHQLIWLGALRILVLLVAIWRIWCRHPRPPRLGNAGTAR